MPTAPSPLQSRPIPAQPVPDLTKEGSSEYKWPHVWEATLETKTWLFVAMVTFLNTGAMVSNTFGPLVVQGFGFDAGVTSLLNIPFGAVQLAVILPSSWLAHRYRVKSPFLAVFMFPVLIGLVLLYVLARNETGGLLTGYYFCAFLFAGNPIIVSWMISNIAGSTKKSVIMSLYNAGASAGNIVGPLLFNPNQAPEYRPGLRSTMGITAALIAAIGLEVLNLWCLNKLQRKRRVANGKPADLKDTSMNHVYVAEEDGFGEDAFLDLTDRKNDEFVYVY